jgi:hypothetical protein
MILKALQNPNTSHANSIDEHLFIAIDDQSDLFNLAVS